MHLLNKILRVSWTFLQCLLCMACLPIAPVATDRIGAARAYAESLAWSERIRQQRASRSLLQILSRAARRQEKMNRRGQKMFDELLHRERDLGYAIKLHAVVLLRILTIGYGYEALGAVLEMQFPETYDWWRATSDAVQWLLRASVDLLPPYGG